MGKRQRNNEPRAGQEESDFNDESRIDPTNVQGKKRNRTRKKNVAGGSMEKKGDLSGQSGGKKAFSWTPAQVIIVLKELAKLAKVDTTKPLDNSSINWEQLAVAVGERLDQSLTRTQIYEKARRLKERYTKTQENLSCGKLASFKNKDDEKMFKLSQKVWGACGSPELQPNEENSKLPSVNLEKEHDESSQSQLCGGLFDDTEVQKTQKDCTSEDLGGVQPEQQLDNAVNIFHEQGSKDVENTPYEQELNNAGNGSNEQTKFDLKAASQLSNHKSEGDIKKTIEVFCTEHQALLKEVEKSCTTILEDMEAKFLCMFSNIARRTRSDWMGVGAHIPSVDIMLQDPFSWDKMTDTYLNSTGSNQSAALESLARQWRQHHLQELNLTSLKLQLMLDECQREKERLEKL